MVFLFESKIGCKAVKRTHNINNAFDPRTANKSTVRWCFKKFYKVLKMRSVVADHQKLKTSSESHHQSQSSYNNTRNCWRTQHQLFYVIWHLKQIEKVKRVNKWMPHELGGNFKKKTCFKVLYYFTLCNNEPFLDCIVMCDKK